MSFECCPERYIVPMSPLTIALFGNSEGIHNVGDELHRNTYPNGFSDKVTVFYVDWRKVGNRGVWKK